MKRSTPIRRTSRKKRTGVTVCNWPGYACRKEARVVVNEFERYCKTHATQTADKLVGDFVKDRDGWTCRLVGFNDKPCSTPGVFWCHIIPKGRYPSIRYEPLNAVTGCRDHHAAFDSSEIERRRWAIANLGDGPFGLLEHEAVTTSAPKVADVILHYRHLKGEAHEPSSV